jgi:hypothetical protein
LIYSLQALTTRTLLPDARPNPPDGVLQVSLEQVVPKYVRALYIHLIICCCDLHYCHKYKSWGLFKSYRTGHVPAATWMVHPPCSWHPGPSSSTSSLSDNLTLIDRIRLIVVFSVYLSFSVGYQVSKCDSKATRGKLNSLSDPKLRLRVFPHAEHYIVSYRIVSLCRLLYHCV